MADNTTQTGNATISTDELAGGVQVQRVKMQYGEDGTANDVSLTSPLPVFTKALQPNVTGDITAAGGTVVSSNLDGIGSATIQVSGTYAGYTIVIEGSIDGTNWVALPFVNVTSISTAPVASVAPGTNATALYNVSPLLGIGFLRVRATARTSGTMSVIIDHSTQFVPLQTQATVSNQVTVATSANTLGSVYLLGRGSNGATLLTVVSAASTNATLLKSTQGGLFSLIISNTTSTAAYVKFYNKASAPTVGTDVPVMTILVPANSTVTPSLAPQGINFTTGMGYAITGGPTTADTTAVAAGQILLNGSYV